MELHFIGMSAFLSLKDIRKRKQRTVLPKEYYYIYIIYKPISTSLIQALKTNVFPLKIISVRQILKCYSEVN